MEPLDQKAEEKFFHLLNKYLHFVPDKLLCAGNLKIASPLLKVLSSIKIGWDLCRMQMDKLYKMRNSLPYPLSYSPFLSVTSTPSSPFSFLSLFSFPSSFLILLIQFTPSLTSSPSPPPLQFPPPLSFVHRPAIRLPFNIHPLIFVINPVLEFLNNLWGLGTKKE